MRITVYRFLLCAGGWLLLNVMPAVAAPAPLDQGWATYRSRFVTADGRVLDNSHGDVSHTEGQGFAMLISETVGDRASFDKIWDWTRRNLQHKHDALFSWRWNPNDPTRPVADHNDAADGDILIAWALVRASQRWRDPEYERAARRIIADVKRHLLVRAGGRFVLLPGISGFKGKDDTIVNPSYYVYPALRKFAEVEPSPEWRRLIWDGLGLLGDARFGRWGLTPDWLDIDRHGGVSPAAKFPARFGFDAIRIPLYLIWGGQATKARLASYLDFWNEYGSKPIPTWVDFKDGAVAPLSGLTGYRAIVQLAREFGQPNPSSLPMFGDNDYYYSASLTLLAMIAQQETAR